MRFKRLIALLTISIYILSVTTPTFAAGVLPGADGWVSGSAAALSPTDTSGPLRVMKSALYPDSYKSADENSLAHTPDVYAKDSTVPQKATTKGKVAKSGTIGAEIDPTSTDPIGEDSGRSGKEAVKADVTHATAIDPREAYGSTMYDNIRGTLVRFGTEFFANARSNDLTLAPVGPNYVVAPGDEVKVSVWGYNEINATVTVDRNGALALPQAGVVNAAGLTFSELRQNIEAAYRRIFTDFDIDVSLGKLHTINVYVAGNATRPGAYAVSSMATVIDVLSQAGGPSASGTMRRIEIKRGDKKIATFDIYRLLLHGDRHGDVRLCDGDIIFIPPVGKLAAAAGNVKCPGIYEFDGKATLADLIRLAGGLTSGATKARVQIVRVQEHTARMAFESELSDAAKKMRLEDGDLVKFFAVSGGSVNVRLAGSVVQPGSFAITPGKTTLKEVLLRAGGLLYTASNDAELTRVVVSENGPVTTRHTINLKDVMAGREKIVLQRDDYLFVRSVPDWEIYRSAKVGGRVLYPGDYAVKRGETLYSLLKRSGGYGENAFVRGAVFIRLSAKQSQQKALDDMINRLERELAAASNEAISTAANVRDRDFATLEIKQKDRLLNTLRQIEASGRIIIHLPENLEDLKGTAYDLRLEEGDFVFIPEHPNTVQVVGAVTAQSTCVFEKGKNVREYIDLAGGFAASANAKRSYIIHPDGSITKAFEGTKGKTVEEGDFIVIPEKMVFKQRLRAASDILDLLAKISISVASITYMFRWH